MRKSKEKTEAIIYVCLAIFFHLLIKIAFGRELWNIIDVIVGIGLLASIFITPKSGKILIRQIF